MKKLLPLIATLMLAGCLATENRKVEIKQSHYISSAAKAAGIVCKVDDCSQCNPVWWKTPYYSNSSGSVWDKNIPREDLPQSQHAQDPLDAEVEFFEKNVIKWPKTMPPAYNPPPIWVTPAPKVKSKDSVLRKKLDQPLKSKSEVY